MSCWLIASTCHGLHNALVCNGRSGCQHALGPHNALGVMGRACLVKEFSGCDVRAYIEMSSYLTRRSVNALGVIMRTWLDLKAQDNSRTLSGL